MFNVIISYFCSAECAFWKTSSSKFGTKFGPGVRVCMCVCVCMSMHHLYVVTLFGSVVS